MHSNSCKHKWDPSDLEAPLAPQDLRDPKDFKDLEVKLVKVDLQDPLDKLEKEDFLAYLEKTENLAKMDDPDPLDLLDHLVLEVSLECLDFLELKDTEDSQVWMVQKENKDPRVKRVCKDLLGKWEQQVHWAHLDQEVKEDEKDLLDHLA